MNYTSVTMEMTRIFYDVIDNEEESLSGHFPLDDSKPEIEKPIPTQPPVTKAYPTV